MYFSSQVDEYLYMLKYALLSTFLCFVLPLGVLIIGILVILWQREKNKSIVLPVIAAIATEAAALVPLIGVLFFTDDGVIYGVCLFFNVTYILTLLSPLTILLNCFTGSNCFDNNQRHLRLMRLNNQLAKPSQTKLSTK